VTPRRFEKHYTLEEARALLPQVRAWLEQLIELRDGFNRLESALEQRMQPGLDLGGGLVNLWARTLVELREVLLEFHRREIQLKDLDRGLIDFPAILNGREVFLCWEKNEDDIRFWHDLDAGYAGREPL